MMNLSQDLLRSIICAPPVLGILMYRASTLRFLRAGDAQILVARYDLEIGS
jgi:hypothetical protein